VWPFTERSNPPEASQPTVPSLSEAVQFRRAHRFLFKRLELSGIPQVPASMRVSSYLLERVSALAQQLPLTCALLGNGLQTEAECCWSDRRPSQSVDRDLEEFTVHLRERVGLGALHDRCLLDVLEYELAKRCLASFSASDQRSAIDGGVPLGPSVRLLRLVHEPVGLFSALGQGRRPALVRAGEFYVVLIAGPIEVRTHVMALGLGRLVWTLATCGGMLSTEASLRVLAETGILPAFDEEAPGFIDLRVDSVRTAQLAELPS
jgi:hypothetical protein